MFDQIKEGITGALGSGNGNALSSLKEKASSALKPNSPVLASFKDKVAAELKKKLKLGL